MTRLFFAGFFIAVLFVSCAASVEESEAVNDTLKNSAEKFERNALWADEIEGGIFSGKLPAVDGVAADFVLSPASVSLASMKSKPVFPSFKDSFSLDVSSMDKDALKILNAFFISFENGQECEVYFCAENLYSLVIFLHDFSALKSNALSHIAGEPFFSAGIYQCPVRIFLGQNDANISSIDVYAYLKEIKQEWKIFQLEIFSLNKNS